MEDETYHEMVAALEPRRASTRGDLTALSTGHRDDTMDANAGVVQRQNISFPS